MQYLKTLINVLSIINGRGSLSLNFLENNRLNCFFISKISINYYAPNIEKPKINL